MEKIIHFVNIDSQNHEVKRNIEAARSLHPGWEIRVWDSPPEGNDYWLRDHYKLTSSQDVLRDMIALDVIQCHGGVYIDSSVCLIRSLEFLTKRDHFFISEHGERVSTAFFGAKKANPIIRFLLDELIKKAAWSEVLDNTATGSAFLSVCLQWYPDMLILPASMLVSKANKSVDNTRMHFTLGVIGSKQTLKKKDNKGALNMFYSLKEGIAFFISSPKRILRRLFDRLFNYMFYVGSRTVRVNYPFGADIITRMNNGINISLPGNDLNIVPHLVITGNYYEGELDFVEKTLSGGDFFIDVGCNVGIYTLVAARKVGPFGRVFAFDPNPLAITHLKRSLFMNSLYDRVKTYNAALGDKKDAVNIYYSENCLGDASLGIDERSFHARAVQLLGNKTSIEVSQFTLDEIFDNDIEIKFLKIDVEGFEHKVIAGARGLITNRAIQYIMLELIDNLDFNEYHKNLEAIDFIISCGYTLHRLAGKGGLKPIENLHQRFNDGNFILVRTV